MNQGAQRARILAVLGPTNTGKTHFAIERMLAHETGMIGFPLRLLARENYDRVVGLKGKGAVALVTGEEKIVPPGARYFLCTAESMPVDREVAFLAVDEVQMAADPERGHIFTDRLLHARGSQETILIGSETIGPLIRRLVPEAEFITRPRMSKLGYSGPKKVTRLPRRSAVVGFSSNGVYELAELMRRRRGGTAVVLGALSPRTRNAQVAMYQAGEVDYLVATDAIGMGLNMDIDHVAFAGRTKFDGRRHRRLETAEIAQIAGRAGRHMNDGTFGTTAGLDGFEQELVEAVESHAFPALRHIFWRNGDLDYRFPRALLRSLEAAPPSKLLVRAREAEDARALAILARDDDIAARAKGKASVALLWEICQIPDFRKVMADTHVRFLRRVFLFLSAPEERLPTDWVARQIARTDRTDGDIGALTGRIADIRTWTYVSHRPDWLEDAALWQERARAIEDKLSDALHERLTQRFVDRRAAVLARRPTDGAGLLGAVNARDEVTVEGQHVGHLEGFRFCPDGTGARDDDRALLAAAQRVLRETMADRVAAFEAAKDGAITFDDGGRLCWRGSPVGRLSKGRRALSPVVEAIGSELLSTAERGRVEARLKRWLDAAVAKRFSALLSLEAEVGKGTVRGLAFQLVEALGALPRRAVDDMIATMKPADRRALAKLGVRIGRLVVSVPSAFKPAVAPLRHALWSAWTGRVLPAVPPRASSFEVETSLPFGDGLALGYWREGPRAVRIDRLEAFGQKVHTLSKQGAFTLTPALLAIVDCPPDQAARLLERFGFVGSDEDGVTSFRKARKRRSAGGQTPTKSAERKSGQGSKAGRKRSRAPKKDEPNPDSPFAKLRDLVAQK